MRVLNMPSPGTASARQSGALKRCASIAPTGRAILGISLAVFAQLCGLEAKAGACADLALVLAIDGSGSIDMAEYTTQIDGYRAALASPAVRRALATAGRVEIGAVLWGDDAMESTILPLRNVDHPDALDTLADELRRVGRHTWGNTGIGAAIELSLGLLAEPGHCAVRQVINVSGDGCSSRGPAGPRSTGANAYLSPGAARALAAEAGVTVNGLAILNEDPELAEYYRKNVITGPGAFVMAVEGFETFQDGLVRKLVREIEPMSLSALSEDSR